jgi:hypothetical protein
VVDLAGQQAARLEGPAFAEMTMTVTTGSPAASSEQHIEVEG